MKKKLLIKAGWKQVLLLIACFASISKAYAVNYVFKAEHNADNVYYTENTNDNDDVDDNNGEGNSEISLVVWAKDGSKVAFALSKKPKITFTETDLQITGQNIDVTYALDDMARFTYEKVDVSAMKDIQTEKEVFRLTAESLLFPALKANSTVSVYSLNGTLIFSKTVQAAGEYSFPISNLNTGVYTVTVNGLTYKIVKR